MPMKNYYTTSQVLVLNCKQFYVSLGGVFESRQIVTNRLER